ncbi:Metazoa galactosyltransferase [Echinococcus multilocularis]|uniref:Beta-1,4-galactosyltransferase n=2 Tax=Echinococcus multilocularis TaxID=6211 RepID=A0A068YAN2_ECHMU|nr:Metazoa galactosyltransferase [Echinococcus multilocularis]
MHRSLRKVATLLCVSGFVFLFCVAGCGVILQFQLFNQFSNGSRAVILNPKDSVALGKRHYFASMSLEQIDELSEDRARNLIPPQLDYPLGEKVIILVPYRNRKLDLLIFLLHMTSYMRIVGTPYEILITEQVGKSRFNRAKLFNAALREIFNAKPGDRLYGCSCFAFHDVDKLPVSMKTPYYCLFRPHQLLRYVHYKKGGKPMYRNTLGGITLFTRAHLEAMNGASNSFEGWGGEDDDLYKRVLYIHHRPQRARFDEGQFYEENGDSHVRDKSLDRYRTLAKSSPQQMLQDGLRQTQYTLIRRRDYSSFVWMLILL